MLYILNLLLFRIDDEKEKREGLSKDYSNLHYVFFIVIFLDKGVSPQENNGHNENDNYRDNHHDDPYRKLCPWF
jgi:hypothetical protein